MKGFAYNLVLGLLLAVVLTGCGKTPAITTVTPAPDKAGESSPAVSEGVTYVGSGDGYLCAVDVNTGQELWKFT
jgi:outer membrane protein assembly factor BamB